MAVYERTYKSYQGQYTPDWSRFLVLPRHTFRSIFQSRLFAGFYVLCFVPALVAMVILYANYNKKVLDFFGIPLGHLLDIGPAFFMGLEAFQLFLSAFLVFIVGPALVSPDLNHNAIALYLSRPFSRLDYVAGKLTVLVVLISLFSWIPDLLLFAFQGYLGGWDWTREHLYLAPAIVLGWAAWILTASLIALAVSAMFRRKLAARAFMFVVSLVLGGFGAIIADVIGIWWGHNINLYQMTVVVFVSLHRLPLPGNMPPAWSAWLSLVLGSAVAVLVLRRRVRAYEIVK